MKVFAVLAFVSSLAACGAITFDSQRRHVFIARGGAQKGTDDKKEEAEREQKSMLRAIHKAEERVHEAVSAELDVLFHRKEHQDKKEDVKKKASAVVKKGADKAKEAVEQHTDEHFFPYDWPHYHEMHGMAKKNNEPGEPHENRALHAVEAAEKAVLHAVEAEVGTLFHGSEHDVDKKKSTETAKKAKQVVEKGVKKATKNVEDTQEHRRRWLGHEVTTHHIDDYLNSGME